MIIFKDILSGDELFSDTYKYKLVDGVLYEVEGKLTKETTEVGDEVFGGNASAEAGEDDGGAEAATVSGCNIVIANRLKETGFKNKKEYQKYLKLYMDKIVKRLEETAPDSVAAFKEGAKAAASKIMAKYKDFQFFVGEDSQGLVVNDAGDFEAQSMVALMDFREDGETPYMLFWKDGIEEEKV